MVKDQYDPRNIMTVVVFTPCVMATQNYGSRGDEEVDEETILGPYRLTRLPRPHVSPSVPR